jgi:CheY-like chemotaxis protein
VIDDNPANLDVLDQLLKREGVTPITVSYPEHVWSILDQAGKIDVVFLDLEFPNDSGLEVVTTLQDDSRLSGVPIVAYTVHTSEQNEARLAGFHSFLGKPVNVEQFPDNLRRILSGDPVWEIM